MKKLLGPCVLLLIFSTTARAAPTLFEDIIDLDGVPLLVMNTSSGLTATAGWDHENPFVPHDGYEDAVAAGEIIAALTIGVEDLDPADDQVSVFFTDRYGDEHWLGLLDAGDGNFEQTFLLNPDWLNSVDVAATLVWTFVGDSLPMEDYAAIMTSTLSVIWDDAGSSGPAHAPAPGALLLGSMGVGIVGWLRRRRTM